MKKLTELFKKNRKEEPEKYKKNQRCENRRAVFGQSC